MVSGQWRRSVPVVSRYRRACCANELPEAGRPDRGPTPRALLLASNSNPESRNHGSENPSTTGRRTEAGANSQAGDRAICSPDSTCQLPWSFWAVLSRNARTQGANRRQCRARLVAFKSVHECLEAPHLGTGCRPGGIPCGRGNRQRLLATLTHEERWALCQRTRALAQREETSFRL